MDASIDSATLNKRIHGLLDRRYELMMNPKIDWLLVFTSLSELRKIDDELHELGKLSYFINKDGV